MRGVRGVVVWWCGGGGWWHGRPDFSQKRGTFHAARLLRSSAALSGSAGACACTSHPVHPPCAAILCSLFAVACAKPPHRPAATTFGGRKEPGPETATVPGSSVRVWVCSPNAGRLRTTPRCVLCSHPPRERFCLGPPACRAFAVLPLDSAPTPAPTHRAPRVRAVPRDARCRAACARCVVDYRSGTPAHCGAGPHNDGILQFCVRVCSGMQLA